MIKIYFIYFEDKFETLLGQLCTHMIKSVCADLFAVGDVAFRTSLFGAVSDQCVLHFIQLLLYNYSCSAEMKLCSLQLVCSLWMRCGHLWFTVCAFCVLHLLFAFCWA